MEFERGEVEENLVGEYARVLVKPLMNFMGCFGDGGGPAKPGGGLELLVFVAIEWRGKNRRNKKNIDIGRTVWIYLFSVAVLKSNQHERRFSNCTRTNYN